MFWTQWICFQKPATHNALKDIYKQNKTEKNNNNSPDNKNAV